MARTRRKVTPTNRVESSTSGVYCLLNTITLKRYVGSAINIKRRWKRHRTELNRGIHCNKYLQRAWNKYMPISFEFIVLEECEATECVPREQYWIDYYDSAKEVRGYNLAPLAGSCLGIVRPDEARVNYRLGAAKREGNPVSKSNRQSATIAANKQKALDPKFQHNIKRANKLKAMCGGFRTAQSLLGIKRTRVK